MTLPVLQPAFSAGELAPALWGREDLAKLHVGATTARNLYVNYRGGLYSRPGTAFVGRSKQPFGVRPRIIPFSFSTTQAYALEFGDQYLRFIYRGAYIAETPLVITAFSSDGMLTVTGSFTTGDWIFIDHLGAASTSINGETFIVGGSGGSTFPLLDLDGNPITQNYGPIVYTGSGTAARIYTITTPYQASDLPLLKYAQSADVMSLTHSAYAPMELERLAADNWTLTAYTTQSNINPPAAPPTVMLNYIAHMGDVPTATGYAYVVTAVDMKTGEESVASFDGRLASAIDIAVTAGSITITWLSVPGAKYYNIYKAQPAVATTVPANALYGFMAQTQGTQTIDNNIIADYTQTPPLHNNPFVPGQILGFNITSPGTGYTFFTITVTTSTGTGLVAAGVPISGTLGGIELSSGGRDFLPTDPVVIGGDGTGATATAIVGPEQGIYPGVVSYFQQRRGYANTLNQPDTMFFSQPGAFQNFDSRIPVVDSDAIVATPFAEQVDGIQFMIPMSVGLVVLTGKSAWQIEGAGSSTFNPQPITPSNIEGLPQAFNGCNSQVVPIKVNYDILYVQALGARVRDLAYNFFTNLYTGTDITVLSTHLFDGYQITEWAWCEDPLKIAWAVRGDGALLSLTFMKEQEVTGWSRHDTQGSFWSVCSVSEPPVNAAYFVTSRQRPGKPNAYYIERLDNRIWLAPQDPWCVDCGVGTVPGSPLTNSVHGLSHLAGMSVVGLADGVPIGPFTVPNNGALVLPFSAVNIKIGLAFTPQFQSVYLDEGQPTVQGRRKNIFAVTVRVDASGGAIAAGSNQIDGSTVSPPVLAVNWNNLAAMPNLGASYTTPGGQPATALYTGDIRVPIQGNWAKPGQVAVQQNAPLPLSITAIIPEILVGDLPEAGIERPGAQAQERAMR